MPRSLAKERMLFPGMENWSEYQKPVKILRPAAIDADEITAETVAADIGIIELCKARKERYQVNTVTGKRTGEMEPDFHLSPTLAAVTIVNSLQLAISEEDKDIRKPTIYWWNGKRWLPGAERIISQILYSVIGDLAFEKGISEMFNRIRNIIPIVKFDADLDVINLKNGLFNWRTREFKYHSPDDPYPSLIQYPIEFDSNAKCPRIDKIIANITPNPVYQKTLKEWIAYCFYRGYPINKALWLYGEGGTGKSTFTKIEDALFGDENIESQPLDNIAHNRFSLIALKNKSRNNCGETPANDLKDLDKYKRITGGDRVSGEEKFKNINDTGSFQNFAKIECMVNELPRTKDKTTGFYRRALIIPFMHKFTDREKQEQAELLEAIKDPKELAGLFNECIALLPNLMETKHFAFNPTDAQIAKTFTRLSEPIETFLKVCVIQDSEEKVGKEFLYKKYEEFSKINGNPIMDKNSFDKHIRVLDCVTCYKGEHKKREGKKMIPAWPQLEFNEEGLEQFKESRERQATLV